MVAEPLLDASPLPGPVESVSPRWQALSWASALTMFKLHGADRLVLHSPL